MADAGILSIILGMALVTYGPRCLPLLALASRSLSPALVRWLSHVPASVLAALLAPELLLRDGHLSAAPDNLFLWVSLPVFALALKYRSLFIPVLAGMLLIAGARLLGLGLG